MSEEILFEKSSGNVFADLGIDNPDEALLKAQMAKRLSELIAKKRMTQAQVARILEIDQPKVSALLRGRLTGFSTDRLCRFLEALGYDITVQIKEKPASRQRPRIRVLATW